MTRKGQMDRMEEKIDRLTEKVTELSTEVKAIGKCSEDHELILRGPDKMGGLVAEFGRLSTQQKLVVGIMATIGTATLSGVVMLIIQAVSVANALSQVAR